MAWQAILGWKDFTDMDVSHLGLDWAELTQWFLWDKVGRAVRCKIAPKKFKFEEETIGHRKKKFRQSSVQGPRFSAKHYLSNFIAATKRNHESKRQTQAIADLKRKLGTENSLVYIPHPSERVGVVTSALIKSRNVKVITKRTDSPSFKGSYFIDGSFQPAETDIRFCHDLVDAIVQALKRYSIDLLDFDIGLLDEQILNQTQHVSVVEWELAALRPDVLLVHGDNHYPHQEYVAVARREGIPTVTFQHGLDCERYYLDDLYVSHMATWSQDRNDKYRALSQRKAHIEVTGNPSFSKIRPPCEMNTKGDYILWITRPHNSRMCYSPSRHPIEGIDILQALLGFLNESPSEKLIIKPHPSDLVDIYEKQVKESPVSERVRFTKDHLRDLIPDARIVVTEDSTGGLDAMFHGKPLVHAHFAESDPVMPFVSFGAALPGFSREMLADSLRRVKDLDTEGLKSMMKGQLDFIQEFAGPLDGERTERVASYITEIASVKPIGLSTAVIGHLR